MAAHIKTENRLGVNKVKKKDIIKKQWRLSDDPSKINKNSWNCQNRRGSLTLYSAEKNDPYIDSRLALWQWLSNEKYFPNVPLIPGINGEYTVTAGKQIYYALPADKGTNIDFQNKKQVLETAAILAQFHLAAHGFNRDSYCFPLKNGGRHVKRLEKLLQIGEKICLKNKAVKHCWNDFLKRGERSLTLLCNGSLNILNDNLLSQGNFTYGKIEPDSFCYYKNKILLTNPNNTAEDISIFDLWQLCRRYLKCGGEPETIYQIIDSYNNQRQLIAEEYSVLYAMILFPYDALKYLNDDCKNEVPDFISQDASRNDFYEEIFKKGREKADENSY